MISESVKSLQKKKLEIQVELNELLHSSNKDSDKINELKSEILYLDKQIEKKIGKKEIQRREELKRKQEGIEDINKNNYYGFKRKFKKISPMSVATNRALNVINKIQNKDIDDDKIRIKVV